MFDYHHALLLRLLGIALSLDAWIVGGSLIQRLPQGIPICWHHKP